MVCTVCCDADHSNVLFMSDLSLRMIPVKSATLSPVRAMTADVSPYFDSYPFMLSSAVRRMYASTTHALHQVS
jgi:hypothetical protein